jgi:hypothetical protein
MSNISAPIPVSKETDMASDRGSTPGHDLRDYLIRYPWEVAFGDEEPGAVFDRYHTPDFVLVNDGLPLRREQLLAHVRPARNNAASVHIEVHEIVTGDDRVAARYTLTAVMRKGHVVATEIFMFGQVADDGRLHRTDQLTRTLPSGQE